MATYAWDEIGCEWTNDASEPCPGWGELVATHKTEKGEVREYRSDHNHLAIEVEGAESEEEAYWTAMKHSKAFANFMNE